MSLRPRLALCTTVYPSARHYVRAWLDSVDAQTDRDVELIIGVDAMTTEEVCAAAGRPLTATWVMGTREDTPATLRERAFRRVCDAYPAGVFVDIDDLLAPERVAWAREQLADADAVACGLDLVDEAARPLGIRMPAHPPRDLPTSLPRTNIFGLSNTAYASSLLARCLPIPRECVLVDWYLATRAFLAGGRLAFDPRIGMRYRQHPRNTAKLLSPSVPDLQEATRLVLQHHEILLRTAFAPGDPRQATWQRRFEQVTSFAHMLREPARAAGYLSALAGIEKEHTWWEAVAHPQLATWWT